MASPEAENVACDRPVVTKEMVEAGIVAYMTSGIDPEEDINSFMEVIGEAMLRAQQSDSLQSS